MESRSRKLPSVADNTMRRCSSLDLRKLPAIAAHGTFAERRHRFIGRSRLSLTVTDLLLTALAAGQTGADTPLSLGDHGLVHVFLLQFLILCALLVTLQLLVCHAHKAIRFDEP